MFVSDKLVFLELHKTGGTHIGKLLSELVGGEQVGKHNRITDDLADRFVIGSVRNPWDWYVSLWAFGCGGKGSVRHQVCDGVNLSYYRNDLANEMGVSDTSLGQKLRSLINDLGKPRKEWLACYADAEDPALFHRWLQMLLDPARRFDVREGFGFSPLSKVAGLMNYRYFKLFTDLNREIYTTAVAAADAQSFEQRSLVNYIIRNEHLEDDFLDCMQQAGIDLSAEQREQVIAGRDQKTNTSERRPAAYYYDQASVDLIAACEPVIIARHGYTPPA